MKEEDIGYLETHAAPVLAREGVKGRLLEAYPALVSAIPSDYRMEAISAPTLCGLIDLVNEAQLAGGGVKLGGLIAHVLRVLPMPAAERQAFLARMLAPGTLLFKQIQPYASSLILYTYLAEQAPAVRAELEGRGEFLGRLLSKGYMPDSFLGLLAMTALGREDVTGRVLDLIPGIAEKSGLDIAHHGMLAVVQALFRQGLLSLPAAELMSLAGDAGGVTAGLKLDPDNNEPASLFLALLPYARKGLFRKEEDRRRANEALARLLEMGLGSGWDHQRACRQAVDEVYGLLAPLAGGIDDFLLLTGRMPGVISWLPYHVENREMVGHVYEIDFAPLRALLKTAQTLPGLLGSIP